VPTRTAPSAPAFVDILRDFLSGHQAIGRLARRWQNRELEFAEVQALVGDRDEEAVLFRLKERCHALFRGGADGASVAREELFDLAVGALFHECMKFRENFYQLSVYGPKMRALRASGGAGGTEGELFREFEKILAASQVRLEEALQEALVLLRQTRVELEALLRERPAEGLVARFFIGHREEVERVFEQGLDELLADLYGSGSAGYELAGGSLLGSGYYQEAAAAFRSAHARAPEGAAPSALLAYAEGMQAFSERDYPTALEQLDAWLDAAPVGADTSLAALALAAISRVGGLLDEAGRARLGNAATALADRIRPLASAG
jgi:tetratricopeptide (TPR) repeat protein